MKKVLMAISICLFAYFAANAQQNKLEGTVRTTNNEPIANAVIQVLNANVSTTTNGNGNFILGAVANGKIVLKCSALGYAGVVKAFSSNEPIAIVLYESSVKLDEIVVSAQKTDEQLLKIPASISGFTST